MSYKNLAINVLKTNTNFISDFFSYTNFYLLL